MAGSGLEGFHRLAEGGAERAVEGGLVFGGAEDLGEGWKFEERDALLGGSGDGDLVGGGGGPGDGIEEVGEGAPEAEKVVTSSGSGAEDGFVAVVELDEGGVDPAGGDLDAVGTDHGDLLEPFLESLGHGMGKPLAVVAVALGVKVDEGRIEGDFGVIDDFGEEPEFHRVMGVVGGEAEADAAVGEAAELAEEDPDEGAVDGDGVLGAESFGNLWLDLAGHGFLDEDEEEAAHRGIQHGEDGFGH